MVLKRASECRSTLMTASVALLVLAPVLAHAKTSKPLLPQYILSAHTIAVMIDPEAGISLSDPNANQTAQRDVETALLKWGRFTTVIGPEDADLIIVLRKGHGKLAEATVSDPRQNSRVGSVSRTDNSISIGAQHGTPTASTGDAPGAPSSRNQDGSSTAHPQVEAGGAEDSFQVYEGKREDSSSDIVGWRWIHKNGLHAHDVPAVEEFRKAIAEAEQAAQQQGKHP